MQETVATPKPSLLSWVASRAKAAVIGLTDDQWNTKIQIFVRDAGLVEVDQGTFRTEYRNDSRSRFCILLGQSVPSQSLCYIGKIAPGGVHPDDITATFEETRIPDGTQDGLKLTFELKMQEDGKFKFDDRAVRALYKIPDNMTVKISKSEKSTEHSLSVRIIHYFHSDNYVLLDSTPPPIAQPTQSDPSEAFTAVGPVGGRRRRLQTTKVGKRRRRRGTARPRRRRR